MVLILVGGVVADRFSRRSVLVATSTIQAASQLAGAAVLATLGTDGAGTALLMACAAVNGGASAFARPAMSGMVPVLVSREHLQSANALIGLAPRIVGIVGATIGAALVSAVGASSALAFDATTFVGAAVLFLTLGHTSHGRVQERRLSPARSFLEGWEAVRGTPWIWGMIMSFGIFQFAYFPAITVLGPELARTAYASASTWAFLLSAGLVGGIVGLLIASRIRTSRPLLVVFVMVVPSGLQVGALGQGWWIGAVAALAVLGGIGLVLGSLLPLLLAQVRTLRYTVACGGGA